MKDLKRYLATLIALCMLAASTLAFEDQKQGGQKPPPKNPNDVPTQQKPPPPRDTKGDKKGGRP
jgi:hypothetical protein